MLKRNDLVKRFEETTKQEIINHNRAIAGSNSAIGALRQDLKALQRLFQDHINGYMSFIQDQTSQKHTNKQHTDSEIKRVESRANDALSCCQTISEAHNKLNQRVLDLSTSMMDISDRVVGLWKEISNIDEYTESVKADFFNELERLKHVFTDRHEKFIQEVSLKPKELDILEDSISYRIDEIQANQSCTHDELEIVKKDVKYLQKQVEYLISHVKGIQ
jgi:chromosome segregation ATPase